MSSPFTTVQDQEATEYLNTEEAVGHLLIVRPQKYQAEGFVTEFKPEGTDVVFCDVADLDAPGDLGQNGKVYRGNSFLQGYLKGTFKRYLGKTLIGMIYFGPREKGRKPPYMWQDLSADANVAARGLAWMQAHQDFLVEVTAVVPEATASGPPVYVPPAQTATTGTTAQVKIYNQHQPGGGSTLDEMRRMQQQAGAQLQDPPF